MLSSDRDQNQSETAEQWEGRGHKPEDTGASKAQQQQESHSQPRGAGNVLPDQIHQLGEADPPQGIRV